MMRLLTHEDPNVRYHALLAVQKIMVHNWLVEKFLVSSIYRLILKFYFAGNTLENN